MLKRPYKILVILCCLWQTRLVAQLKSETSISLEDLITTAEQTSLDAFRAKYNYNSSALEFKNFKVSNLPTVNLNIDPLVFNSSIVERYDAILDRDVFRTVETLNSNLGLSLTQNITATGGNVFVRSNINRLENTGSTSSIAFNNNLVQLGFNQPLFNFNSFKWRKKTDPLVFEIAKKTFIEAREHLHVRAVDFFFNLAAAQLNHEIATNNYENARKLFDIGQQRFDIATINKEELLNLELNMLDAEVAIQRTKTNLKDRQLAINIFLGNIDPLNYKLTLPETIFTTQIEAESALKKAQQNSSEVLDLKLSALNAERDLDRIKKQGRLNPTFSGLIGLNKNADNYLESYQDPLAQKRFSLRITVPILNWGTANRQTKVALNRSKIISQENKVAREEFKRRVITQINEFNLQSELVDKASRSKDVAIKAHQLVLERFKYGNIDIVKLNASRQAKDRAINAYLNSLRDYWTNFYALQRLTLTDLKTNEDLEQQMEGEFNMKFN